MSAVGEALRALSAAFAELEAPWFLFGAHAVSARGAPRATQDLDVTVECASPLRDRLAQVLLRNGFSHRFPEIADELLRRGAVLPLVHTPTSMDVDVVFSGSGLEQLVLSRSELMEIDGVRVPVASATDLVVMKLIAGRGKDLEDARTLIAAGDVSLPEVEDLLTQMEEALGVSDLLPRLLNARSESRSTRGRVLGRT
jgi:hypothetical protein